MKLLTRVLYNSYLRTYVLVRCTTQASGADFDMVMSTKEQETFETALSARDGFASIKEELSRVDVRQVCEQRPSSSPGPWL